MTNFVVFFHCFVNVMKLTFCFQLFLAYFCISAVKCQSILYTITPYSLDINNGELIFDLSNVSETAGVVSLEFDLNRVVISNCPDTCETGVKQNYRLSYEILSYDATNQSGIGETVYVSLQEEDQVALALHDYIGLNHEVYIRFENGFVVNQDVYLLPSGWNRVFYYPYNFNTYISNSNTTCTEKNLLLFKMEWITYSPIIPTAYEVRLTVRGLILVNESSAYENVTFIWITQGVVLERYLDFEDTRFVDQSMYYDVFLTPLPMVNGLESFVDSGYFYLVDPESFDIPEVEFGDGVIVVNIPFRPGFGICSPPTRDNLYCTDLTDPNDCIFRDYSMTTQLTFTRYNSTYYNNYNYNNTYTYNGYTTILTVRYEESEHKLFGVGVFPLSGDIMNDTTLVFNYFQTTVFYSGPEYLGRYTTTHYSGLAVNYTYEHLITVNEVDGYPIIAEPFCTNGEYIDNNLIRVKVSQINFGIPLCSGVGYLTISAVGDVIDYLNSPITTRSILISELDSQDYLIAPLLQYRFNSWFPFYYIPIYRFGSQSHRETVHLRIGQYCESDASYTVFNTSITLPFIAPSSDSAVVTGEGNENVIIVVLKGHGFCFDRKDANDYYYFGLTNPSETWNVLGLTQGFQLSDSPDTIYGDCVYEGSLDGDILYTCSNFSEALLSPIYTGKLIVSHSSLLEDVVLDGFEVKVVSTSRTMPEFELPYGLDYGDREVPRGTNVCGDEIALTMSIPVGESIQRSVYVSSNGVISFGVCAAGILPTGFPDNNLDIPVLAPFWTQHDHREFGNIFYRYVEDGYDIWNVTRIVRAEGGDDASSFEALWAVIVTWVNVPPYPADRTTFFKCAQLGTGYSDACDDINSYQVILTTDGRNSYFITDYQCEYMKWSGNVINAVVGFSVPEHFATHKFSGQSRVSDIGCSDLSGNPISRNVLVYKISLDSFEDFLQTQALMCFNTLRLDFEFFGLTSTGDSISRNIPCPCSQLQARLDRRFVAISDSTDGVDCYTNRGGAPVRCCYSSFTATLDTYLSVYTRFSFRRDYVDYSTYDSVAFAVSCSYDEYFASLYSLVRSRNTCSGYRPPRFFCIYGDPHFITIDDYSYTFNGVGEYVLLQSTGGADAPIPFTLLGRTGVFSDAPDATILTALAFRYNNILIVEVRLNLTATFQLSTKVKFQFDPVTEITDMLSSIGSTYSSPGLEVEVISPGNLEFFLGENGSPSIVVSVKNGVMDYLLTLPSEYKYRTEGLMGIWNDDQSDDLTPAQATFGVASVPLPLNASLSDIHYSFGITWKVGVADTFFFYESGLGTADYTDTSYVPAFPDDITYSPEAEALCGDNMACLFDFSQTGNEDIADTSSTQNTGFFVMQSDLANFPPTISLSAGSTSAILLTPGVLYAFDVLVTDEEEGVTLVGYNSGGVLYTALTSDLPLTKVYYVSIQTDDASPFSLSLQATDVRGANASLHFDITVCACGNGVCRENMYSLQSAPLRFKLQACLCDVGWGGDLCDQDSDGCYLQACYPGVSCTDLPPPSIYGVCGDCPLGTEGDGMVCVDVNECFGEGAVSHDCTSPGLGCVNTEGSYRCECLDGYIERENSCEDINECLLNPCEQLCLNTDGDYSCGCYAGLSYNATLDMCEPDNACAADCGTGVCVVIGGSDECVCGSGYLFDSTSKDCVDIDECTDGLDVCQHTCTNIAKSYTCSCDDGYRINSDFVSCNDINECEDIFSLPCPVNETCVNTVGSRMCVLSAAPLTNPFILVLLIALLLQCLFAAI